MTSSAYRAGDSPLHRIPAGPKLLALIALSVAIVAVRGVIAAVAFVLVAAVAVGLGRPRLRWLARSVRGVLLFAVVVALLQWWWTGPERALESLLDLTSLALLALALGATTRVNDLLDAVLRALRPLRPLGVDPERVALTVGLAVRSVPDTVALAAETRAAAKARGLDRSPRAHLTPFVIRVVARAHQTGDALEARGLGDG